MLEDDITYVIRKALKGLGISPSEAAARAGLPEREVLSLYRGNFSAVTARQLAPALGLDPDALAAHDNYLPAAIGLAEIQQLALPFGIDSVNAWLIQAPGVTILFDTGVDPHSCIAQLGSVLPDHVFLTHPHTDHIGGLAAFRKRQIPLHAWEIANTLELRPRQSLALGPLTLTSCDLTGHGTLSCDPSGHAPPALGYHISGLSQPVLVVGDALFAGSVGGCISAADYRLLLGNLAKTLVPLLDSTILLPGHGPATTLGEERISNPFL
jgi:hydroxyacylglutathione hydrolase